MRDLFITFAFAFFKSETLCIMQNERNRTHITQIHRSILKLLQKKYHPRTKWGTSRGSVSIDLVQAMFKSMKAQDDEAHLEYEFARYLVRRCESKRIWCRDYINGKASHDLRSRYCFTISMLHFGDLFGSFTMVLTVFNDSMYCFFNQKELAQIFERVKSVDLHPTEP
ncbi:hypothetical protein HID58_028610, partial [Brassica napus]